MAEENKAPTKAADAGTPPSAADTKAANKSLLANMEQSQAEKEGRQRAQSTDSKLTTAGHLGKRPDEPHKPYEMESVKTGKPLPTKAAEKGLVEIDPGNKGEATDIVNPAGFLPGSGMHTVGGGASLAHDQHGTIAATAAANDVAPGDNKTPAGKKPDAKLEGDPGAAEAAERHAGENAEIPALVNSPVAGAQAVGS